jgi:hypothetical protein
MASAYSQSQDLLMVKYTDSVNKNNNNGEKHDSLNASVPKHSAWSTYKVQQRYAPYNTKL